MPKDTSPGRTDHEARTERLGLPMLAVYGSGALVQDVLAFGLNTLLLFYLTIVCGLSGSAAGLALGLALVVDSFVDPLVGSLSDNSRSRHGRRHPWMLASAVPVMVAFFLLFSIPPGLSGTLLFAYATVTLLATRIALSCFVVPFIALGAELSDDYAERSSIVASRVLFSVLAGGVATFLAYGVFMKGPGGQTHREAYPPFAIACGALALAGAALSTFGTLGMRDRLHAAPRQGVGARRFFGEVAEVFRNPSFRTLFLACLILFVALGAAAALALHANTYFWKLQTRSILLITLCAPLGILAGVFVAAALVKVMEKRTTAMGGIALIGLCQFAPVILKLAGLIPAGGEVATLMIATGLAGAGGSVATIGFQSMMADAADEHEHLFGARREGLYFAGISLSAKASSGVGALIAGVVLDIIGFPHGLGSAGPLHAAIPAQSVRDLGLLYGPGAAILTAVSVVILSAYRRGRVEHAEIRTALDQRRLDAAGEVQS